MIRNNFKTHEIDNIIIDGKLKMVMVFSQIKILEKDKLVI